MDQFGNNNEICPNATNNRVYINRNFNRFGTDSIPTSNSNVMYFNPNFSYAANAQHNIILQKDQAIRPKIHFNPNFIRPNAQEPAPVESLAESEKNKVPSLSQSTKSSCSHACCDQPQVIYKHQTNTQMPTVSKSRYCLVRQKENKVLETPLAKTLPNNTQQTVKVGKYKLVSLNTVKENLATDQNLISKISQTSTNQHTFKSKYRAGTKPISNNAQNTRFKFVKHNSKALLNSSERKQTTIRRVSITLTKSIPKMNPRQTLKNLKGAMKKNNIPCPLFKKFGKCLRMVQGSCDYLHDKKHVSICRKFLKGICHNKHCLLSHELTHKKMPTCYFYLQGICTKDSCPYLHVKLNEKTKICQDFVKGYCEKGDKCIHRHVDISSDTASKVAIGRRQSSINKRIYTDRKTISRKNTVSKNDLTTLVQVVKENQSEKESEKDQRYFRDAADNATSEDQYGSIKPSRCKLGTLPSFIQL